MGVLNIIWKVWKTEKEKVRRMERERERRRRIWRWRQRWRWEWECSSSQNQSTTPTWGWECRDRHRWKVRVRKKQFFLFRSGMHLPAEIRYLLRYGRNDRLWAGIFSGTKQPCFYTSQGTGKVNTSRTGRYGTKLTSLSMLCSVFS